MRHGILSSAALLLLTAPHAWAQTPPTDAIMQQRDEPVAPEPAVAAPEPAAAPPAPPVEPLPPPAPPAPAPAPEEAKPEPPKKLAVGKEGFWKPGVVAQVWAFATHSEQEWQQTSFRLRRLELKWSGEILPDLVAYTIVMDPARLLEASSSTVSVKNEEGETIGTAKVSQPAGSSSIVQDAVVTVLSEYADVSMGQFKIPVSYDAFSSVAKLLLPERSTVARRLGERRDIGIKAEKKFKYFSYVAAMMNGEGQNRLDTNDQKDLALRLEAYPVEGLTLAGVGYTSVGERKLANTKDRIEGDLRFEASGLLVQGEYIRGTDRVSETSRVTSHGFYGVLGYTFAKTLQPLVRFGYFDPNVKQKDEAEADWAKLDEQKEYSVGLTYYLQAHEAKFQLAASVFDYHQAPTEVVTILCGQASF
jgi:Phosphate-selective porin O and P